jgi:hypothetical protein
VQAADSENELSYQELGNLFFEETVLIKNLREVAILAELEGHIQV